MAVRKVALGWLALLGALAFSIASYSRLPQRVPIHWNIEFEPDGYTSRWIAAVVVPLLFFLVPAVAWLLPRIDPRRTSYAQHRDTYWSVINLLMLLLAALQVFIVGMGLGWEIDAARVFPVLIGALFIGLGNLTQRLRPNWFIGIRTPWTLSSDEVWRRTHRLGARAMVAAGALLVLAGLQPTEWFRSAAWIAAIVIAAAIPAAYSYVLWRQLGRPERAPA